MRRVGSIGLRYTYLPEHDQVFYSISGKYHESMVHFPLPRATCIYSRAKPVQHSSILNKQAARMESFVASRFKACHDHSQMRLPFD